MFNHKADARINLDRCKIVKILEWVCLQASTRNMNSFTYHEVSFLAKLKYFKAAVALF